MPNEILDDFQTSPKLPEKRNFQQFYKRLRVWAVYIIISTIISGLYSLSAVHQVFLSFDPDQFSLLTILISISILFSIIMVEFIWEDGRRSQKILKLSLTAILFVAQAAWVSLGPRHYLEALEQLTTIPPIHFLLAWTLPVILMVEFLTVIFQLLTKNKRKNSNLPIS